MSRRLGQITATINLGIVYFMKKGFTFTQLYGVVFDIIGWIGWMNEWMDIWNGGRMLFNVMGVESFLFMQGLNYDRMKQKEYNFKGLMCFAMQLSGA